MNKSDLIEVLKNENNLSRKNAEKIVTAFWEAISECLSRGERAEIRGFGSFSVNNYKAYVGRNPKTGENIKVPAKRLPFFKVGKELKERVDFRVKT